MIKDVAWVIFSLGGLVGLLSRNRDFKPPEPDEVALQASLYADAMIEQFKNRFCGGLRDNR